MSERSEFTPYRELFEGDNDSIGLNTWVGIIAAVLSGLSILTIAGVYFSQRKCCRQKKKLDSESILLKKRLQLEQKKMATYKCKFPFIDHPSCTSIMQQEENDIADEVKESYSHISTNISKPIICCPDKKMSYCYDPKLSTDSEQKMNFSDRKLMIDKVMRSINRNLYEQENLDTISVHEIASEALQKIANSTYDKRSVVQCNEFDHDTQTVGSDQKFIDSIENGPTALDDSLDNEDGNYEIEQQHIKSSSKYLHKTKSSKNLFTESEIQNAEDIKSLFFEKWMKQAGDKPDEISEESIHKDVSISYDDVDSVLTSISRMDTCRMKKLKNTRFYKRMVSGMQVIKSESVGNNGDFSVAEDCDVHNNDEDSIKQPVTECSAANQLHLTQEELNHIAVYDNNIARINSENLRQPKSMAKRTANERKTDAILREKIKALRDNSDEEDEEKLKNGNDEASEVLFKSVRPTSYQKKNRHLQMKNGLVRRCSSCSDISENTLTKSEEEEEEEIEEEAFVKCKSFSKAEKALLAGKQSSHLTNWSKTRSTNRAPSTQHTIHDTEYTKTYKTGGSSYSHKGCASLSTCSCSTKTTTWEEIALKEKEKHYNRGDGNVFAEGIGDLGTKDTSKSDVYYIISNNNCFVLPAIDEKNGCTESDITPTSYYRDEGRKMLSYGKSRNTT